MCRNEEDTAIIPLSRMMFGPTWIILAIIAALVLIYIAIEGRR